MAKGKSIHIEGEADKVTRVERDELADLIINAANKYQKDGAKVAYYLDEQEDPSMVTDWISTGSFFIHVLSCVRRRA